MIEYRKIGGFAGIEVDFRIEDDGTIYLHRSISGTPEHDIKSRLNNEQLKEVITLVDQANIFTMQKEYKAVSQIFDAFSYRFTYKQTNREKTVTFESTSDVPKRFQLLLKHLNSIIEDLLSKITNS